MLEEATMSTVDLSDMAKQILVAFEPDLFGSEATSVVAEGRSTIWVSLPDGNLRIFHHETAQQVRDGLSELANHHLVAQGEHSEYRITVDGGAVYSCLTQDDADTH